MTAAKLLAAALMLPALILVVMIAALLLIKRKRRFRGRSKVWTSYKGCKPRTSTKLLGKARWFTRGVFS